MKEKWKLEVSPSCYFKKCHPETCCCRFNYVVHDYRVRFQADTEKECYDWIESQKEK